MSVSPQQCRYSRRASRCRGRIGLPPWAATLLLQPLLPAITSTIAESLILAVAAAATAAGRSAAAGEASLVLGNLHHGQRFLSLLRCCRRFLPCSNCFPFSEHCPSFATPVLSAATSAAVVIIAAATPTPRTATFQCGSELW